MRGVPSRVLPIQAPQVVKRLERRGEAALLEDEDLFFDAESDWRSACAHCGFGSMVSENGR